MAIRITCPHCGSRFEVGIEWAGQQGACNSCGGVVKVETLEELFARHLKPIDDEPATPPASKPVAPKPAPTPPVVRKPTTAPVAPAAPNTHVASKPAASAPATTKPAAAKTPAAKPPAATSPAATAPTAPAPIRPAASPAGSKPAAKPAANPAAKPPAPTPPAAPIAPATPPTSATPIATAAPADAPANHIAPKPKRARWAEGPPEAAIPLATDVSLPATVPAIPASVTPPAAPVSAVLEASVVEAPIDGVLVLPSRAPGATPVSRPLRPEEILYSLQGEIPPVTATFRYQLGIAFATAVMLVLPVLYMLLIGLIGMFVFWHMTNNISIVGQGRSGRQQFGSLLIYIGPILFGVTMIFFMIKPIFARPPGEPRKRSLTRESEPLLFAFIERICLAVRAPFPRRIDVDCDVNASASFRLGIWSLLAADDLVLTIGMPFVSGLTMCQFAGVLAHELGHFSQGAGLRLSFLVRQISFWFTRAVYERDAWDEWLDNTANTLGYRIGAIFHLARLCVWINRKILWLFLTVGRAASGYLMQQMEFDADRYEARIAGSDTFELTCRRMAQLNLAYRAALSDIGNWYREGRLGDDLPLIMIARADEMPAELREELDRYINESESSWFDSHPSDRDRIASARQERAPGIFRLARPAAELFAGFPILCRLVTQDMYEHEIGESFDPREMHPSADLLARREKRRAEGESLDHMTLNCFHILRPLPLPAVLPAPAGTPQQLVAEIQQIRNQLLPLRTAYRRSFHAFDDADTMVFEGTAAIAMYRSHVAIPYQSFRFHVAPAEYVDYSIQQARNIMAQRANEMLTFEFNVAVRIERSLQLLVNPEIQRRLPDAVHWLRDVQRFLPIIYTMNRANDQLQEIRNCRAAMGHLCERLVDNRENHALLDAITSASSWLAQQVNQYRYMLQNVEYPFDHAKGPILLADHLAPAVVDPDAIIDTYDATSQLMERVTELQVRILGRLAWFAEQVELSLGLQPLDYPKDKGIEDRSIV